MAFTRRRSGPSSFRDITKSRRQAADLAFSNVLLNAVTESSPDGILVVDANAKIISSNRRFSEMWNIPRAAIKAKIDEPVLQTVAAQVKDLDRFLARVRYLYDHPGEIGHDEIELKDGRVFDRHTATLHDDESRYLGRVWFFRDITERRTAEQRVVQLAHTDVLTGLANRATFTERIEQAIAWRRRRDGVPFAVLYFDLDRFKDINDTLGHGIGDALLQQVADRLKATIRMDDVAARLGGDEFAVLQPGVSDAAAVGILAQRLLAALSQPYAIDGHDIRITASIGIAIDGTTDAQEILRNADLALYRAKDEGRNTYRVHTDEMDRTVRERVTVADDLRAGLTQGQFSVYYQPQIDTRDGTITGVEALVRWRHPTRGILMPSTFISIAELTGLIAPLDKWVMNEACRQMKSWLDEGIAPPLVAVNVSPVGFKIPQLEDEIAAILDLTGLAAERLQIEITETAMITASGRQDDILARLRQRGIHVSIDDFGTGYSSLAYMKRFRPDRIKIAADFVRGMLTDDADRAVVRAIIEMAHELCIGVIAEGVETMAQAQFLCRLGCCDAQGFAYSQAVPADQITALLRQKRRLAITDHAACIAVPA